MPVVLEDRATTCAVYRDEVRSGRERPGVCRRQLLRAPHVPGMIVERAAALLSLDLEHAIPVHPQRTPHRIVDMSEERIHHAAAEECDGRAGFGTGGFRAGRTGGTGRTGGARGGEHV